MEHVRAVKTMKKNKTMEKNVQLMLVIQDKSFARREHARIAHSLSELSSISTTVHRAGVI